MPFDYGKFTNGEYDKYFSADIFHLTEKRGPDEGNDARPQKSWKYIFSNLTGRIASKFRRSTICQGIASIFTKKSEAFSDLQQLIGEGKRIKNSNFLSAIENDKNLPKDTATIEKIANKMEVFGANKEQVIALRNKAAALRNEASNPPLPVSQIPQPSETIKHIPLNQIREQSSALKDPKYALILEFIHLCSSTLPPQTLQELSEQGICPHLAEVLNSYHSLLAGKTSLQIFVQSLNNNIQNIIHQDLNLPYDQEFSAAVCIQKVYEKHKTVHSDSYSLTTIQGTTKGVAQQPGKPRVSLPVILTNKTLQEEFQAFASKTIDHETTIKTSFNTPPKEWWVVSCEKDAKQQNILGGTLQHRLPASCLPDGAPTTYQCDHIECKGEDGMPYSYRRLADNQWQRSDGKPSKLFTDAAVLEDTKEKGISFHLTLVISPSAAPLSQPVRLNPPSVSLSNNSPAPAAPVTRLAPSPAVAASEKINLDAPWKVNPSPKVRVEFNNRPCVLNAFMDWIAHDVWTLNALYALKDDPNNPFPKLTEALMRYLQAQNGEIHPETIFTNPKTGLTSEAVWGEFEHDDLKTVYLRQKALRDQGEDVSLFPEKTLLYDLPDFIEKFYEQLQKSTEKAPGELGFGSINGQARSKPSSIRWIAINSNQKFYAEEVAQHKWVHSITGEKFFEKPTPQQEEQIRENIPAFVAARKKTAEQEALATKQKATQRATQEKDPQLRKQALENAEQTYQTSIKEAALTAETALQEKPKFTETHTYFSQKPSQIAVRIATLSERNSYPGEEVLHPEVKWGKNGESAKFHACCIALNVGNPLTGGHWLTYTPTQRGNTTVWERHDGSKGTNPQCKATLTESEMKVLFSQYAMNIIYQPDKSL